MCLELMFPYIPYLLTYPSGSCLNLDMNGRGVACIKMSHDSEGMNLINVALDTTRVLYYLPLFSRWHLASAAAASQTHPQHVSARPRPSETRNMTNADCLALMMGDDPPQEIEDLFYRFLTSLKFLSAGWVS